MGNRAVIAYVRDDQALPATYEDAVNQGIVGIYLHWNGGEESVQAFLDAAKHYKLRADDYGLARLTQIIGNYFGGGLSLGVGTLDWLDTYGDNGTFVVQNWEIKDHWFADEAPTFDPDYRDGVYGGVLEANNAFFPEDGLR